MTDATGVHTYTYDAANRLTSVDGVAYTWDDNGNLLSDGARTFTYDDANRLVQVVSGTLTTMFTYPSTLLRTGNGDGTRCVTTTYVIAVLGLPHVLVETAGGQSTVYLHGHDGSAGPLLLLFRQPACPWSALGVQYGWLE